MYPSPAKAIEGGTKPGRRSERGLAQQFCAYFFGDRDDLLLGIIIAYHGGPGKGDGHHLFPGFFLQSVIQFESHAGEFGGGYGSPEGIAIEKLALEFYGDISHDESYAGEIQFSIAVMPEELDTNFMNQRKDGVIADVAAVVEIGDADGDFHGEGKMFGQE
jgi:hypothetical protein